MDDSLYKARSRSNVNDDLVITCLDMLGTKILNSLYRSWCSFEEQKTEQADLSTARKLALKYLLDLKEITTCEDTKC